jgi:hypothetical protein
MVGNVLQEVKLGITIVTQLGFADVLFDARGPFPPTDSMRMGIAIVMVLRSLF